MTTPRIGVQLYCVRGEVQRSVPETLRALADSGYAGAEPWGYDGESLAWMGHAATDLRAMFDDSGLACCGLHLSTGALLGDNLGRTIEFAQTVGIRFLIIAMDKARMTSVAGIADLAGILNGVAETLAPLGLYTGYHAHEFDFAQVDGEIAWYRLFRQTAPAVVMQIDTGNMTGGGGDPVATLQAFPGRARSVHLKEFGAPERGAIGDGRIDWPGVFRACEATQPTEWYVVEQGARDGSGFDIPRRSLENLRGMGKA